MRLYAHANRRRILSWTGLGIIGLFPYARGGGLGKPLLSIQGAQVVRLFSWAPHGCTLCGMFP